MLCPLLERTDKLPRHTQSIFRTLHHCPCGSAVLLTECKRGEILPTWCRYRGRRTDVGHEYAYRNLDLSPWKSIVTFCRMLRTTNFLYAWHGHSLMMMSNVRQLGTNEGRNSAALVWFHQTKRRHLASSSCRLHQRCFRCNYTC